MPPPLWRGATTLHTRPAARILYAFAALAAALAAPAGQAERAWQPLRDPPPPGEVHVRQHAPARVRVDLVIALYWSAGEKDPLPWLPQVLSHLRAQNASTLVYVYNKSSGVLPLGAFARLPNVGREAHTYLHHLAQEGRPPSDVTVFLQSDPRPHAFGLTEVQLVHTLVLQALTHGVSVNVRNANPAPPNMPDPYAATYGFTAGGAGESLGAWFDRLFAKELGFPFPPNKTASFFQGACFAIRSVLRLPQEVVRQGLESTASRWHPAAYYLERLWFVMFLGVRERLPLETRSVFGWLNDSLDAFGLEQRRLFDGAGIARPLTWGRGTRYWEWEGCSAHLPAAVGQPVRYECQQQLPPALPALQRER